MKKLLVILGLALPLFFMSYKSEQPSEARVSEPAPAIALTDGNNTVSLKNLKGKYVLLNYWTKSDPATRVANHRYDRTVQALGRSDIRYISICSDRTDETLSRMITTEDGLASASQYRISQTLPSDNSAEYLRAGHNSWLISPEGTIIAADPDPVSLAELPPA